MVRFLKAVILAKRWIYEHRDAAVEFLSTELKLKPEHARKGWEYYTKNRLWHPDADINMDGLQTAIQIYAEQTQAKSPQATASKYVERSYLTDALRELPSR
jgi:hypothetical protein